MEDNADSKIVLPVKEITFRMTLVIVAAGQDTTSGLIESVSQISAEDRARRAIRKAGVGMDQVLKTTGADGYAVWTAYKDGIPPELVPAKPAKEPKAPKAPKVPQDTPEAVFAKVEPAMTDIYARWQEAKGQDGATWAPFEKEGKRAVSKAKATFVSFTNRPFELNFTVKGQPAKVCRNSSGGFKLVAGQAPETQEQAA